MPYLLTSPDWLARAIKSVGGGRELGTQQWQLVAVAELLAMTDIAAFVQNCVNADGSAAGTQSGCVA